MGRTKQLKSKGYIQAVHVWCEKNDILFSDICIRNYNSKLNSFDLYLNNSKKTIRMFYDGVTLIRD